MKKFIVFCLSALLFAAYSLVFSGCTHSVTGNYVYYRRMVRVDYEGGFEADIYSYYPLGYKIDTQSFTYSVTDGLGEDLDDGVVISGGTAPRDIIDASDGYEKLISRIEGLEIENNDSSVVDCIGWENNGCVYGFCNIYADTVGYLSGGGNYAVEEVDSAVIYAYDGVNDDFKVLNTLEGVMVVAYSDDTVIYHKNKSFYSYCLSDGQESFLIENLAYGGIFTAQPTPNVYFDDNFAIFRFWIEENGAYDEKLYLYSFESGVVAQLELIG